MEYPHLIVKENKADGTIVSTCQLAPDNFETIAVKNNSLKAWGNPVHQVWSTSLEEAMTKHKQFLEGN
ncbi:hypothetical protein [Desulfovibrio sp. An276]|uniref:hypothetical protein n=1 Tax=Desulfovibrio sp. An276 TaxID=1965618 RepID=UPI000B3702EE|nr:hypothetical protein [Desulfovibrio sp. An276]